MFKVIPQDKANHELYGARIAAVAAIAACLLAEPLMLLWAGRVTALPPFLLLLSGASAIAVTVAAAITKEWLDDRANEEAEKAGLPPPHSVEVGDLTATIKGGVWVGLPLLAAWAVCYL